MAVTWETILKQANPNNSHLRKRILAIGNLDSLAGLECVLPVAASAGLSYGFMDLLDGEGELATKVDCFAIVDNQKFIPLAKSALQDLDTLVLIGLDWSEPHSLLSSLFSALEILESISGRCENIQAGSSSAQMNRLASLT